MTWLHDLLAGLGGIVFCVGAWWLSPSLSLMAAGGTLFVLAIVAGLMRRKEEKQE